MVRGRDACWEHCLLVDAAKQKVRCNYCEREFSGGVYRMKFHLAQIKNKDIVPCTKVPDHVRDQIHSILTNPRKHKTSPRKQQQQKSDRLINNSQQQEQEQEQQSISSASENASPSQLFPRSYPCSNDIADESIDPKHEEADKKIALFFLHNSIPFGASKSLFYQEMVDSIAECGPGYKGPSYANLRTSLLERVKLDFGDFYKRLRDEWRGTGCTILCETLSSDDRTKSLLVFSVSCPKGTLFLKTIDVTGHDEDVHYLFEILESVVLEMGIENVVQVITGTTTSYVYAGRLLMAKYPNLFWSPCASDCINKILEDFSEQDWVDTVLNEANTIAKYIYSCDSWVLSTLRKFMGGQDLIRPRIFSRILSLFLVLRSVLIQEDNLKHMFSRHEWQSVRAESRTAKTVLYSGQFWTAAREAVSVSEPLIKVLRIVDGDMPAMGYVFEGMERAKVVIKAYYKGVEEKYVPVWEMIDRRWNVAQLHSPLHAAAAFLNPSILYGLNFKIDPRVRNGFQEAMVKMAREDKEKIEITKEHPIYINAQGALGTEFAIMGRTLNSPGDWWAAYGYEVPVLQRVALRILTQPCSSHWCNWNWNTFQILHSRQRSEPKLEKLNDLVFVHCNLRLQAIVRSREGKSKPIVFDEIDVGSEWPMEFESPSPLWEDSWLENLPL